MPVFVITLLQLLPYIPNIIRTVEELHGPGNGQTKLSTAVQLLQLLEPKIAPMLTDDKDKQALIHNIVGIAVGAMNASGTMPKPVTVEIQP